MKPQQTAAKPAVSTPPPAVEEAPAQPLVATGGGATLATVDDNDYSQYAGQGFEGQSREDYSIPFFTILQGLSPQCETLEGARPGKIVNTVTNLLLEGQDKDGRKGGLAFVPALTQHVYVQWRKRKDGGGFVAVHQLESDVVKKARAEQKFGEYEVTVEETDEKGNKVTRTDDLNETFYVYGIAVLADGSYQQAVLGFVSTKIKKYRNWMTTARTIQVPGPNGTRINPPLFAHRYRLRTVKESNSQGDFYNWETGFDGADAAAARLSPRDPVFLEAVALSKMVRDGAARASYESQAAAGGDNAKKGDIPF